MRGRAIQLVCLVLLLSSLSAADASALRPTATNLHRIGALFAEAHRVPVAAALPMRPAALYTAATHAVTGSSL